jgi:hypothetical protein
MQAARSSASSSCEDADEMMREDAAREDAQVQVGREDDAAREDAQVQVGREEDDAQAEARS